MWENHLLPGYTHSHSVKSSDFFFATGFFLLFVEHHYLVINILVVLHMTLCEHSYDVSLHFIGFKYIIENIIDGCFLSVTLPDTNITLENVWEHLKYFM